MRLVPINEDLLDDFGVLLHGEPESSGCWCMWFIKRVADYHADGDAGNRADFTGLVRTSPTPMGLLAYDGDAAVGWCAVGPRSRYTRVLKAPTLRGRDRDEDDDVWLVPCFLVRSDTRRSGIGKALLQGAVELARGAGARAVEGFPLAGSKTRAKSADFMTGTETLFESCGFAAVRRPSDNRVIMRRELA